VYVRRLLYRTEAFVAGALWRRRLWLATIHSEVDLTVMSLDMASQVCAGKVFGDAATH
jgi:hypothetical protein